MKFISRFSLAASGMDTDSILSESDSSAKSSNYENIKPFACPRCDKYFSTRFSRKRHYRNFHESDEAASSASGETDSSSNENESDEELSVTDSKEGNRSVDETDNSNSDDESIEGSVTDGEEEMSADNSEYEIGPFDGLVEQAFSHHYEEYNEPMSPEKIEEARRRISKTLRKLIASYILNMEDRKRDPLFKAIIEKTKQLEEEGFEKDEAVNAAVSYWKHSINKLISL